MMSSSRAEDIGLIARPHRACRKGPTTLLTRYSPFEAWSIKQLLGLPEQAVIKGLKKQPFGSGPCRSDQRAVARLPDKRLPRPWKENARSCISR